MYADDTVLYVHGKTRLEVAQKLTEAMTSVSSWLADSCVHLNTSKTVCMYFSKRSNSTAHPDVTINGENIKIVDNFKYLGIILDSHLTFKKQVNKVVKTVKFGLSNFRIIRPYISLQAAKLYMHAMILSHFNYCLTSWSQTGVTTLRPVESLYKQTLKVLDRKPNSFHHCHIISKYNLFNMDSFKLYTDMCLVFRILNGLAPLPLNAFIKIKNNDSRVTRSVTRGDCVIPRRHSSFGNSAFSVRASKTWNSLPIVIRNCINYHTFKFKLKHYLKSRQICTHE